MNVPDVNVLVALYRPDHVHHARATRWWEESSAAGEPFIAPDLVWVGFVRIATDPRVFAEPATFDQAWQFALAMMAAPTYRRAAVDAGALSQFARLGRASAVRGNLVTDTYIGGFAAAHGATVVTFDRDFRKFDGLRVEELTA